MCSKRKHSATPASTPARWFGIFILRLLVRRLLWAIPLGLGHQIVNELFNGPKLGGACVGVIADYLSFTVHNDHRVSRRIVGDRAAVAVLKLRVARISDELRKLVKIPDRNRAGGLALSLNILDALVTKRAVTLDDESVNRTGAIASTALDANLCDAVVGGGDLIVASRLAIITQLVARVFEVVVGNLAAQSKQAHGDKDCNYHRFHGGGLRARNLRRRTLVLTRAAPVMFRM